MVAVPKDGASLDVSSAEDVESAGALELDSEVLLLEAPLAPPEEPDAPDAPVVVLPVDPVAPVEVVTGVLVPPCVVDELAPAVVVVVLLASVEPVGAPVGLELVSTTVL